MSYVESIVRREPWEVEPRLAELQLKASSLRRVRDVAMSARANVTDYHAANASGTFAYQDGTWCLRDACVGEVWKQERPGGVEAIFNSSANVRVAFANVDRCCDVGHDPRPISVKGAGAERLCEANLFGDLPTFTKQQSAIGIPLFYCMVDQEGRVELSRPTIVGSSFGPCVERNFISFGGDDDGSGNKLRINPSDEGPVDITPTITRKVA